MGLYKSIMGPQAWLERSALRPGLTLEDSDSIGAGCGRAGRVAQAPQLRAITAGGLLWSGQ